jgi:hypothetical protein
VHKTYSKEEDQWSFSTVAAELAKRSIVAKAPAHQDFLAPFSQSLSRGAVKTSLAPKPNMSSGQDVVTWDGAVVGDTVNNLGSIASSTETVGGLTQALAGTHLGHSSLPLDEGVSMRTRSKKLAGQQVGQKSIDKDDD